jgi:hypothetical protein
MNDKNEQHIEERLDELLDEMHKITGAFARNNDGSVDFDGHRRYHESMIEAAEAQTQFWRELKLEVAKKGIWGLLVIVCGLIVVGLMAKFGLSVKA